MNGKEIKFLIFNDCTYKIFTRSTWSDTCDDFAAKYIELRDAGFTEV